jgi:hypothetical protein
MLDTVAFHRDCPVIEARGRATLAVALLTEVAPLIQLLLDRHLYQIASVVIEAVTFLSKDRDNSGPGNRQSGASVHVLFLFYTLCFQGIVCLLQSDSTQFQTGRRQPNRKARRRFDDIRHSHWR